MRIALDGLVETAHPAQDIYYAVNFGRAYPAPGGVNGSSSDARPNVSRDGLEIVWDSNRTGTLGMTDIWTARRTGVDEPWGTAVHLGNGINSPAAESRASLSWDGTTLLFGSTRMPPGEGSADVYPRHGPTMEWDIAAGHAVLEAAGGSLKTLEGEAFQYGKADQGFKNGWFVARGG